MVPCSKALPLPSTMLTMGCTFTNPVAPGDLTTQSVSVRTRESICATMNAVWLRGPNSSVGCRYPYPGFTIASCPRYERRRVAGAHRLDSGFPQAAGYLRIKAMAEAVDVPQAARGWIAAK